MNTVGIALVWCVVQVTLIGTVAAGVYLLVRRLRPAAAASVLLSGLVVVVALSLMMASPWPRWAGFRGSASPTATTIAPTVAESAEMYETSDLPAISGEDGTVPSAGGRVALPKTRPSLGTLLWQSLWDELAGPQAAVSANGWRWPAIVAIGLLAASGCGLAWLWLGVLATRDERRRSDPVQDPALLELVDVLCAELSCRRPIEIRQSADLATAATIGWRRPVLLLPNDWTTWTAEQRRAVLAHEIAHARSGDFLALLLGQLGLVLHFYHPLLHWLVSRLRLEQELAADAAAADLLGGRRDYLTAIAELALRQQDRPLSWPARSFLPTQTTFLRRIAMLRSSNQRFDRGWPAVRFAAVGAVLLCGLLAAGLRGPASSMQALAAEVDKPTVGDVAELKHDDGKPDGKRSLGGSGEMIQFSLPAEKGRITGVRIHGSRYGTPQPPAENFMIYVLNEDRSEILFTETAPYRLFQRGKEKWVDVKFKKAREVPKNFWIVLDFKANSTKGVYVSFDNSTGGKHSKAGLPGQNAEDTGSSGWMIRVKLATDAPATTSGDSGTAQKSIRQQIESLGRTAAASPKPTSVHITAEMRTPPQDNFSAIGVNYEFVPMDIWKQFDDKPKWRVEKPARVAVMDGKSTVMLIQEQTVVKIPRATEAAFDTGWLLGLCNSERLVHRELRAALAEGWGVKLADETSADGEKKVIVTVDSKSRLPENDYMRNKFFGAADMRLVYRFDAKTARLEGFDAYLRHTDGDVKVFTIGRIEYDQPIAPKVFTLEIPKTAFEFKEPQRLPDNEKYEKMTPVEAVRAFFEACAKEDWDEAGKFCQPLNDDVKQYLGGLEIVSLGEPFKPKSYPGWMVPYEIKFKNGETKSWNLAVRKDNLAKRYVVDGGL